MKLLKWVFIIIVILIIVAIGTLYFLFKENPSYVLKHLDKNSETSSLYLVIDDKEKITYESDVARPLASVSKIMIALEYAYQIENGELNKDDIVPLSLLEPFYIKDTDGGAHEAWMDDMKEQNKIHQEAVQLHDVASGMMTYSSNANAEYLINLLGADQIDKRIAATELEHDAIIPIVGSLAAIVEYKKTHENWEKELKTMSDEKYQALAIDSTKKLIRQEIALDSVSELSMDAQRIWSDRLSNASAAAYGKLLNKIAAGDFSDDVSTTIRDLLEWPMEEVEGNKEHYQVVGAKGGSTAFVYNQAMYVKTLDGTQIEIVLFTDDLSIWQTIMLQNQGNNFILQIVNNEDFLDKTVKKLMKES